MLHAVAREAKPETAKMRRDSPASPLPVAFSTRPPSFSNQAMLQARARPAPSTALRPSRLGIVQRSWGCDCSGCQAKAQQTDERYEGRRSGISRASARVIAPAEDPAEREADAIADAIIGRRAHDKPSRTSAPPIQAKGAYGGPCSSNGGQTEEREPEETPVQAKLAGGSANSNAFLSTRLNARHGGGEPLPSVVRQGLEPHLGVPLGGVRVHRDAEAGELARSIGALAFAAGRDVYFAPGYYAPHTNDGARLIAHELVHVAQQTLDDRNAPIRRFTLKGFSPAQETQMRAAVPSAKTKMLDCSGKGIPQHDIADIVRGLDAANYVFAKDLGDCGHSNPLTDTIEIGASAFNHDACCDLDSTLAHECAHSFAWGFESFARKVECKCFGCSCGWGK
jgi:uncharacterized protein DUF4157